MASKASQRSNDLKPRELPLAHEDVAHPTCSQSYDELQVIEDEIDRLPGRFRDPILLCCLESASYLEAARRLCCSEAILRNRLSRGRKLLRDRLKQRGIAVALIGPLSPAIDDLFRPVPPSDLVGLTFRSSGLIARGSAIADKLVPAAVVRLMHLGTTSLAMARARQAALVFLAIAARASLGIGMAVRLEPGNHFKQLASVETGPRGLQSDASSQPNLTKEKGGPGVYKGQVLGPDGAPVAGAKLFVPIVPSSGNFQPDRILEPKERAKTDQAGRFEFTIPEDELAHVYSWSYTPIFATGPGFGPGWEEDANPRPGRGFEIKLAATSHRRKLLDLEGKPITGTSVRAEELTESRTGNLDHWCKQLETGERRLARARDVQGIAVAFLAGKLRLRATCGLRRRRSFRSERRWSRADRRTTNRRPDHSNLQYIRGVTFNERLARSADRRAR